MTTIIESLVSGRWSWHWRNSWERSSWDKTLRQRVSDWNILKPQLVFIFSSWHNLFNKVTSKLSQVVPPTRKPIIQIHEPIGMIFIETTIALKSEDKVLSLKHIQKSYISVLQRWEQKQRQKNKLEAFKPASLGYMAQQQKQERPSLEKVEGKNQFLKVVLWPLSSSAVVACH